MVVSSSTIEDRYDIMCLKIIRLSKNHTYTQSSGELIGFLTDLVNDEMSKQEKLDSLAGHGSEDNKNNRRGGKADDSLFSKHCGEKYG